MGNHSKVSSLANKDITLEIHGCWLKDTKLCSDDARYSESTEWDVFVTRSS